MMDNLEKLKAYQAWRRGGGQSIFETMTATEIGSAIDWAIAKCEQLEQVERDREQLKAQVKYLRQLGAELINNSEGLTLNRETWRAASLAYGNVGYKDSVNDLATIINKTPAQCLAAHDAEVAAKAEQDFIKAIFYAPSSPVSAKKAQEIEEWYGKVKQLSQQAKAGE